MRVYSIGIAGHHPERFRNQEETEKLCREVVNLISYQYSQQEALMFNVGGEVGAEQWVANACIEAGIDYHMFLPYPPELLSEYWWEEQQNALYHQMDHAAGITILSQSRSQGAYDLKKYDLVDNSDFLIAFWEGRLIGRTYNTIRHAVEQSKIVLNGLSGLSLISKEQLQRRDRDNMR